MKTIQRVDGIIFVCQSQLHSKPWACVVFDALKNEIQWIKCPDLRVILGSVNNICRGFCALHGCISYSHKPNNDHMQVSSVISSSQTQDIAVSESALEKSLRFKIAPPGLYIET